MKNQVYIKIGAGAGSGKTTTALGMVANAMQQPNTICFFLTDEMTGRTVIERLGSMGAFQDASNLPVIIDTNQVYSELDGLLETLSRVSKSLHVYVVADLMTMAPTVEHEFIESLMDVLGDRNYNIVTTTPMYRVHVA